MLQLLIWNFIALLFYVYNIFKCLALIREIFETKPSKRVVFKGSQNIASLYTYNCFHSTLTQRLIGGRVKAKFALWIFWKAPTIRTSMCGVATSIHDFTISIVLWAKLYTTHWRLIRKKFVRWERLKELQ